MILLSAFAAGILVWWLVKPTLRLAPERRTRLLKRLGGMAALAAALLLLLRGRIDMALLLGGGGLALLQPYADRWFPGWRKDAERDADPRPRPELQGGAMTPEEAYQVLGLEPGASNDSVRDAHRQLMRRLHPDGGGSTYLASRVNQAKDVLLGRHR